jgi:CheY-like chemotaxis protein
MDLAVVLGVVRAHGGVITVASEPSRGSVLRVFLPVSAEAVPGKPFPEPGRAELPLSPNLEAAQQRRPTGFRASEQVRPEPGSLPAASAPKTDGAGTVLVVEDEPMVRKTVTLALKRLGFTVLAAEDGVEGVKVFQQHQDEIRCVLCDLTMPRMNGWETLTALRKLAPGLPVILASGYSEAQVMEGHHPELPQAFLSKPYEQKALINAISQVLANKKE